MDTILKPPRVSIVVPVFNTAPFLKKCLSSIQNQSFQNIEVLIVNDATPDESVAIARQFTATDDRFRLLHHDRNKGLGPARNTGIEHAVAPFIMFVDSDDWIERDCTQALYRAITTYNADIAQCGTKWVYSGHTIIRPNKVPPLHIIQGRDILMTYNHWKVPASILCMAWGKIYRKDLFIKNHIRFPNIIGEDVPTTYQLCYFARRAVVQQAPFYYYRQHADSKMGVETSEKKIRDLFIALEIMNRFINKQHCAPSVHVHFKKLAIDQIVWYMLSDIRNKHHDDPELFMRLLEMVNRYYLEYRPILQFDGPYLKYCLRFVQEVNAALLPACLRSC